MYNEALFDLSTQTCTWIFVPGMVFLTILSFGGKQKGFEILF